MEDPVTFDNVLEHLLARVPELAEAYAEHVTTYDEPIAYVFIGDVRRFAMALARGDTSVLPVGADPDDVLHRLFGFLEEASCSQDQSAREFVGAGFMEAMDPADPTFKTLVSLMGPETRRQLTLTFPGYRLPE